MKETFGLCSLLTVGSSMWISITACGFERNLNKFLSCCSYAAAVLRCLFVCLSVKRVHCDKKKATSASIDTQYEKLIHVVL